MPKKLNITLIENNEKKEISVDEGIKVHSILHNFQTSKNTISGIKINNEIGNIKIQIIYFFSRSIFISLIK